VPRERRVPSNNGKNLRASRSYFNTDVTFPPTLLSADFTGPIDYHRTLKLGSPVDHTSLFILGFDNPLQRFWNGQFSFYCCL